MSKIFVNYRSSDTSAMAVYLHEKLVARFGKDAVFRDDQSVGVGVDFREVLWNHLRISQVVLVLIGRHWLQADSSGIPRIFQEDDFVRQEIAEALSMPGKLVVPVLVAGQPRLTEEQLPDSVKSLAFRQYRHVRDRSASRDIDALIEDVADAIGAPKAEKRGSPTGSVRIDNRRGNMTFGDGSPIVQAKQGDAVVYPPDPDRPPTRRASRDDR